MDVESFSAIAQMGILFVALWVTWRSSRAKPFEEIKKLIDELTKRVAHLESDLLEIKGYIRGKETKN